MKSAPTNHKQEHNRIFILNETILRTSPALAVEIGLNESIVLLQLEFWISISNNIYDGRRWTYQSVRDMQEKAFPFWSIDTINRTVNKLIARKYIIEGNYNKAQYDKTRWFALNFEVLANLKSIAIKGLENQAPSDATQNRTGLYENRTRSPQNRTTIPENTTDIINANPNFSENPDDVPNDDKDSISIVGDDYYMAIEQKMASLGIRVTASPVDSQAMAKVKKAGVAINVVLSTMDEVFANNRASNNSKKIRSFGYFVPAIMEAQQKLKSMLDVDAKYRIAAENTKKRIEQAKKLLKARNA